jgi:transposase
MKYRVSLNQEERILLKKKVSGGVAPAREIVHAQVLLKIDRNGPGMTDPQAADALDVSSRTVQRIRESYVRFGLDSALGRRPQPARPKKRKVDDELEVRLIALACSDPPEGRRRWTLRLLSEKIVELELSQDHVSRECVRRTLKKTNFDLTASRDG